MNCKFKSAGCQCPLCLLSVSLRRQSQRLPAETCEHHLLTASCTSKVWCLVAKPVRDFAGHRDLLQAPHLPPQTQPQLPSAALVHSAVRTQQAEGLRGCSTAKCSLQGVQGQLPPAARPRCAGSPEPLD